MNTNRRSGSCQLLRRNFLFLSSQGKLSCRDAFVAFTFCVTNVEGFCKGSFCSLVFLCFQISLRLCRFVKERLEACLLENHASAHDLALKILLVNRNGSLKLFKVTLVHRR